MNWYKTAQYGEWWIIDGKAVYADGDTGEMGHEAYVLDAVRREIAETFNQFVEDYYDWDEIKQQCISEYFDELNETEQKKLLKKYNFSDKEELIEQTLYNAGIFDAIAIENGNTKLQVDVADNAIDPRDYGMKELGWKRVQGQYVQTYTLTSDDLKSIDDGLWDAYGESYEEEEMNKMEFSIEVMSNRKTYQGIPYEIISKHNPMQVAKFGGAYSPYAYAKKQSWYKKARLSDKDPSEGIIFSTCQYCGRWATQEEDGIINEDERIWKKNEQLNQEESNNVSKVMQIMQSNNENNENNENIQVSHGICPTCMSLINKQGIPYTEEDIINLKNISLQN